MPFEPLFNEQCEEWLELLGWDYSAASELIRQVVRDRDLNGFVALSGNTPVGFTYYVIENIRCSIGEIFIAKAQRGLGVDRRLAEAVIDRVGKITRVRRLESQRMMMAPLRARVYARATLGLAPNSDDATL